MVQTTPGFDDDSTLNEFGVFRFGVAGIVKDLIRARRLDQPDWEPDGGLAAWISDGPREKIGCNSFLTHARTNWRRLSERYLESSASMPSEDPHSQKAIQDEIIWMFAGFTSDERLAETQRSSFGRTDEDWEQTCEWGQLPELRKLLNRLPTPSRTTVDPPGFPITVDDNGRLLREKSPVTELKGKVRQLLVLLLRSSLEVDLPTVEDAVWGVGEDPTPDAIRKLTSRLNQSLKTLAPGWSVRKVGSRISLEYSPPSLPESDNK